MEFKDVTPQIAEVATRYHYHKPPGLLVYLQELVSKIMRLIKDLLEQFHVFDTGFSDTRMVGNVMQLLLYVVGAICFLIIMYLVWMRMNKLTQQSQLARAGALESESLLTSEGWLAEANKLADRGNYKSACRAAYLSFLRLLDEKGVTPYAPTRTNYEYWYQLSKHKNVQRTFRKIADTVELVWFGNKQADAEDFQHCLQLIEEIKPTLVAVPSKSLVTAAGAEEQSDT